MAMRRKGRPVPPGLAGWLAWGLWALAVLLWVGTAWIDRLLRQAGLAEAAWLVGSAATGVVAAVSAATVGAVLGGRRPRHPVGWLLLALGLAASFQAFGAVAGQDHRRRSRGRPAGGGDLPEALEPEYSSPENPLYVPALEVPLGIAFPTSALLVVLGLLGAAGSLLGRFRRARGVERQQLRWLAFGGALAMVSLLVAMVALETSRDTLFQAATGTSLALLPLATGAAILRYRLYDLDRIVSRTLAYGLLSVLLGLGYAAVVLGLGRLLPQGSTLAVAALFQPARRRVQRLVDRRFNRRRYDAAQTVSAFGARLRDEVDLGALRGELLAVVDQTMQPTRTSLWLRPQPPRRGEAAS
jgi:hypothetical protein